ncbi:Vps54p KNAG_0H01310 [Huiozyma naganishii CBS 8797]|uniref:Vacuolar protein sorting-associated protein 54 C-terminal domain-containing protein n=1 Tax=Huiozyma naganishii (strain ATCC MYA-139 / BCRC 22969 / CBS 8797 / KCTC 17520 / NBRC 10181 / NCYC 3082 / Yp74L-3) TaxID=1071383 RepID=J7S8H8_HUIN7|nr:hypothetical protein KNAG_0H01310 [Kazachstania naganishii CBS 8797]CCK71544.1 hypothetical protein KNAG_0H01310 [Kazachstania naganishii CBS 8797]
MSVDKQLPDIQVDLSTNVEPSSNSDINLAGSIDSKDDRDIDVPSPVDAASRSRPSFESISTNDSLTTTTTTTGIRRFPFSMDSKSGSVDYSPLGNNSIFELVMNTRRKDWLRMPSSLDIPPVSLSKNSIAGNWKETIEHYVKEIKDEEVTFKSRNNLRNMNKLEQVRQLSEDDGERNTSDSSANPNADDESMKLVKQIPDFYFEKAFQLDNERIFNKIIEDVDISLESLRARNGQERDNAYIQLKDKLNGYLDAVEFLLVTEISKSSHKFFHALGEVEHIREKAAETVVDLQKLSKHLQKEDEEVLQKKIKNIELIHKRKNVEKLEQGLLQVKFVVDKVEECKSKFERDELEECLELIKSIDSLIKGNPNSDERVDSWTDNWPYKLLDIRSVPALLETREFLTNMQIEIGGKYSLQLAQILLTDLKNAYQDIDVYEIAKRIQSGKPEKNALEFGEDFQKSIRDVIVKLNQCEELTSSFVFYLDKAMVEVKNIIKNYLPHEKTPPSTTADRSLESISERSESATPLAPSSGSKLSKLLKEQTPLEFQNMLMTIFITAIEALKRLYKHQKLLLDISLREINSVDMTSENQHNMITQLDIRTGLNDIIHVVQLRMGKVIAVRRELTATLRHDHFLKLYAVCVLFIQECESLSGEFLTKYLSDVLSAQIKNYITIRDSRNIRTIQKKLELESWVPFIVPPCVQKDVNDIVSCTDIDPIDWTDVLLLTKHDRDETDAEDAERNGNSEPSTAAAPTGNTGNRKSVVVGDKTFVASDSLLATIDLVKELLILSTNLPTLYLPYFERMSYNVLRYFNSYAIGTVTLQGTRTLAQSGKNLSILGETLDCLAEFGVVVQKFYQRLASGTKDFKPYEPARYVALAQQYRDSSELIFQARAPPPPM